LSVRKGDALYAHIFCVKIQSGKVVAQRCEFQIFLGGKRPIF